MEARQRLVRDWLTKARMRQILLPLFQRYVARDVEPRTCQDQNSNETPLISEPRTYPENYCDPGAA